MQRPSWVAVLVIAGGVSQDPKALRTAPEPLELTVADGWMPVPVFVVPELALEKPSWKKNAGWAHHDLHVEHRVAAGVLEIDLDDGDDYCGAPLHLRLASDARGGLELSVSGSHYSCVTHGVFCDLHGEVHVQRRSDAASPLRLDFRIDAMESEWLWPLRTEGAVEIALARGEWDARIVPPGLTDSQAPDAPAREVRWRWSDGTIENGVQQGWWIDTAPDGSSWKTLYRDGVEGDR